MTENELDELIEHCPKLYHMAERGSWDSIKENGILSTTALLDLYGIENPKRQSIEKEHRPESVKIDSEGLPCAVIRDQKPMSDGGLIRCLPENLTPSDWYEILNKKVFFWLTEERLHKLTGAKTYRNDEHDVLEVNTRLLVNAYRDKIWLCPINSGCTKPFPRNRDESIFARISDYDYQYWSKKRRKGERAVELAVDYSIPDIRKFVERVIVKRGDETIKIIE